MAEILKFRKIRLEKPVDDAGKLKSILKRAVNSEQPSKDLVNRLGKMIRKQ
jgi:hypothetical protein